METPDDAADKAIVAKVMNGDTDAYSEIVQRYQPKLHRYVTYLIHNESSAYDIEQDTFVKAYQNLRSFNPRYKFSSWIYRIAHNETMNAIKKVRYVTDVDITTYADVEYASLTADKLDANILKAHVDGCINKLDPKYREVIQLIYFEHMKYDEASEVLRVPTSTVGVWLSRAKKQLKAICEQKGIKR